MNGSETLMVAYSWLQGQISRRMVRSLRFRCAARRLAPCCCAGLCFLIGLAPLAAMLALAVLGLTVFGLTVFGLAVLGLTIFRRDVPAAAFLFRREIGGRGPQLPVPDGVGPNPKTA